MAIFSSKKAATAARMLEVHGTTGTEEEYRNLRPTIRLPKDPNMGSEQSAYNKAFASDPALLAKAQAFGEEHWWKPLCQSANREPFYNVLFDKWMFDDDGVLDIKEPGLSKVVQSMAIAYMHITRKFADDPTSGWTMRWTIKKDVGPYLDVFKASTNQRFGMSPPSSGFFDHAGELKVLRQKRDAGESMTIPEDMMKHYSPEQVAELEAIGEGWGLIEDADTDEFDEARAKIPKEVGYVYKVADSKPARRGWFS